MDPSAPKRRKTSPTESAPVESTTPPGPPPPQQEKQPEAQALPVLSPQRPDDLPASRPTSRDENSQADPAPIVESGQRGTERDGSASLPSATVAPSPGTAPRSPVGRAGGTTLGAQLPHRTPTRPQPRPLPPPEPTGQEDELLNPFLGRSLRRSPTNTGALPAVVREEPSLPPTPRHPDPVVSTPPSGIHNTPSKRRRDGMERESSQRTSSPVKEHSSQEAPPQKPPKQVHGARVFKSARRQSPAPKVKEIESPLPPPITSGEASEKGTALVPHPRRSVRLWGPGWEKAQKRDALLQEIAQLEADLELAREEHVRAAEGSPSSNDPNALLDLLRRRLLPPQKDPEPDPSARWVQAAMDPFVMLGFNGQSSIQFPPVIPPAASEEESQPPIISHHPVAMTASEELPYLQVFTPLSFVTDMTTISDQDNQNTYQKHTIGIRSASPPSLFTARMEMVVNTRTQAVTSLAVPQLDPAAAPELRPFLDSMTDSNAPYHPALSRNVSILCFAMGEWYRLALKRAKFWHALDKEFGPANKDGFANAVSTMRTRKKSKRRAREAGEGEGGIAEDLDGADSFGSLDGMMISKKELLPHMGRASMDLQVPCLSGDHDSESSEVRVNWGVQFDWTGVAKSELSVQVGVPGKWRAVDERKSIVGIPKLFTKLLHGGEDPLTAVKTVVALLAGEPAS